MPVTKALALRWANEGFPGYYRMITTMRARYDDSDYTRACVAIRRMKRSLPFPRMERFPTVLSMEMMSYRNDEETLRSEVRLEVDDAGRRIVCNGHVISNRHVAICTFDACDGALCVFCEHFAFHLIFNVLDEEEISFEEWNDLPD